MRFTRISRQSLWYTRLNHTAHSGQSVVYISTFQEPTCYMYMYVHVACPNVCCWRSASGSEYSVHACTSIFW